MTGAERLSSDLQPVMANAAPLCLSTTVDRTRPAVSGSISSRRHFRQGWKPEG